MEIERDTERGRGRKVVIQTPGGLIHRIPFQYLVGGFHMFPLPIHPFMHWIRYPQLSTYVNLGELCPPSSGWVSELPKSRSLRHAVCFMRGQWNHQSSWACFNHYINTLWTGWWVMHVSARCRPGACDATQLHPSVPSSGCKSLPAGIPIPRCETKPPGLPWFKEWDHIEWNMLGP